jgi:hypothetical protein
MTTFNLELSPIQAYWVHEALVETQKGFTHNPNCVPDRITIIREVVESIEKNLEEATDGTI